MVSKQELLKHFQKNPEKYWKVSVFEEEGFVRRVCPVCGKGFWSITERSHCPDPACGEEYGFIGKKVTKQKLDYVQTWKALEKFFKEHGHASIPRYPVIARWRDDIYFTIASIVDFQRFDDGVMTFDYPANPLIVPQVCLRFNDIANVGVTGRHHTSFVMPGQHAFNWPKEGYWKDECMRLNFEFLTKVLGIPKEEIVYVEELWTMPDFSAFGPYIEAYVRGLELVNSGFMEFTWQNGIKPLPMKVIDVGWGLERLVWISNGTPTGYDAVFADIIKKFKEKVGLTYDKELFEKYAKLSGSLNYEEVESDVAKKIIAEKIGVDLKELEEKIEPVQAMYAIIDHVRTLSFAIADGALPSNSGGGYYLRLILRRALQFIRKFGWNISLGDVAAWNAEYLRPIFPELKEKLDEILKILEVEGEKFKKAKEEAKKLIEKYKDKKLPISTLVELYDTKGISPEDLGLKATPEFYDMLSKKHPSVVKKEEKKEIDVSSLEPTEILFYEPIYEFKAKVLKVLNDWIVLDRTAFYPTQGGQLHDVGEIDGKKVLDVRKVGNVVLHKIEGKLEEGKEVFCKVDKSRREALTKHHDAVHIVNGIVKKLIGSWCNQAGSEVSPNEARLDITHYQALSEEEVDAIEKQANDVVEASLPIRKMVLPRMEAEKKYGFGIYQGGYVPSKQVRIVEIPGVDVEACGGTHGDNTKDVGWIVITKVKKISDSVVRIELKAGEAAYEWLKEKEKLLSDAVKELGSSEEKIVEDVNALFERWKKLRKQSKSVNKNSSASKS